MKKATHYTLMFIPEDNGKTFTLRIRKFILRSIVVFIVVFISGLTLLIYKSGEIAAKLQLQYAIKADNERLIKENKELRKLSDKLNHVDQMSKYLERLAVPKNIVGKQDIKGVQKRVVTSYKKGDNYSSTVKMQQFPQGGGRHLFQQFPI